MSRMSALLTTEGSYPFHRGDVSTWCHSLTTALSEVDFTLLAVTTHPYLAPQFEVARNVRSLITVPVSGIEDPAEYGNHASLPEYLRRHWATTSSRIEEEYLPHFEHFLHQITHPLEHPGNLGPTLLEMHLHLRSYDYDCTQTHPDTWATFTRVVQQAWREAKPGAPAPSVAELLAAWRLLYRLMLPLSVDLPRFDLAHSAAPGFCGLPCIVAKLRWGTPYLLTEHGAYLHEHYLGATSGVLSVFLRWFASRLTTAAVDVNYAFADQVSPVCQRTAQWEQWRGVDAARVRTIYNGIDPASRGPLRPDEHQRPTVVSVGEFTPLKRQLELIEAAALVRRTVPNLELRLYGAADDEEYYQRCRDVVQAMGLQHTVVFADEPADRASALQHGHVVALAGVSEGLPYVLLDAMLAKAAIVATDAGGVREALGDAGLVVPPGDPVAMAEALNTLLHFPDTGRHLGECAHERVLELFTEERFVDEYRSSYERLTAPAGAAVEDLPVRMANKKRDVPRDAAVA